MTIDAGRAPAPPTDLARVLLGVVDEQGDGVLVVDPEGRILHANQAFAAIWGIGPDLLDRGSDDPVLAAVEALVVEREAATVGVVDA